MVLTDYFIYLRHKRLRVSSYHLQSRLVALPDDGVSDNMVIFIIIERG